MVDLTLNGMYPANTLMKIVDMFITVIEWHVSCLYLTLLSSTPFVFRYMRTEDMMFLVMYTQPEPELRPPMSDDVQALVRLMERASVVKRQSSDDTGFIYKTPYHEAYEMSY